MTKFDQFYTPSEDLGHFARSYFSYLSSVLDSVDIKEVNLLGEEIEEARQRGCTVFTVGNGGSASTASTMANVLGFDLVKKTGIEKPIKVMALTDNTAVLSAIANDVGYENVFLNQLKIHFRTGDKLVVISVSGRSPNVVNAAEWVHSQGGRVIGLLGFDGGTLKEHCDVVVHFKTSVGEYGPAEDAHFLTTHMLAHWFQNTLKQQSKL